MEFTQKQRDEIARLRMGGNSTENLCRRYGVTKSELDEWATDYVKRAINAAAEYGGPDNSRRAPVFEHATDGTPTVETVDPIGYIDLFDASMDPRDYYGLLVRDDSMAPDIRSYTVALVKIRDKVWSEDLAAVQIGHNDFILRNVKFSETGLTLEANNKRFLPAFYTWQDVRTIPVRIIGSFEELRIFF